MSANAEPVDEFAAATEGMTEGHVRLRYRGTERVSGQYGPQHSHRMEVLDPETGEKIDDYRHYTEIEMKRGNRQWQMTEAFLGRPIEKDEQVTPAMIRNRVADGFAELNQKGRPKVTGWYPVAQPAPTPAPSSPAVSGGARAQPTLPAPPAPPRTVDPATGEVRTAVPTVAEVAEQPATERQREQIAAILPEYPEGRVDQYCLDQFGVGLAHLTRAQAGQLLVAHMEDAIGPF